jgi:ribosomal protein S18 acetylase RimI-like enzyme
MIRNLETKDKENWAKLYIGYADFYKVPMNTEILDTLWKWIHDKTHVINAICFELKGEIVGIAHYRTMPRPIKGQYIGFLDDLFVQPEYRGHKIAQKLISHLKSLSKDNNWDGIRWITHSSNKAAKNLYNKIAINTGFELYELKGN